MSIRGFSHLRKGILLRRYYKIANGVIHTYVGETPTKPKYLISLKHLGFV